MKAELLAHTQSTTLCIQIHFKYQNIKRQKMHFSKKNEKSCNFERRARALLEQNMHETILQKRRAYSEL